MNPWKMYFLLIVGVFQPAMLVYQRLTYHTCFFLQVPGKPSVPFVEATGLLVLGVSSWCRHDKSVDKSVVSICFYVHLYLGKMHPFWLEHFFQMGWVKTNQHPFLGVKTSPKHSMYGIFTYIYHKNKPNVGKYTSPIECLGVSNSIHLMAVLQWWLEIGEGNKASFLSAFQWSKPLAADIPCESWLGHDGILINAYPTIYKYIWLYDPYKITFHYTIYTCWLNKITFHYTGWLIGILIMPSYNHYNPLDSCIGNKP